MADMRVSVAPEISVKSRSFPTVPAVRRKEELDGDGGWMQPLSWQTINYF